MIINYSLFVFTDYAPNVEIQYNIGYFLIAVIAFNVAMNVFVMIWQLRYDLYLSFLKNRRRIRIFIRKVKNLFRKKKVHDKNSAF
jgi:hypothetical protein